MPGSWMVRWAGAWVRWAGAWVGLRTRSDVVDWGWVVHWAVALVHWGWADVLCWAWTWVVAAVGCWCSSLIHKIDKI
jgi:hypothetical protein